MRVDRIGQRFGRLVVIATAPTKGKQTRLLCRCDCGNEKDVQSGNLTNGHVRSCGCLAVDHGRSFATHGHSYSLTYRSWLSMKQRCHNENHTNWPRYGGRGISVCERWRSSFENFLADMGPRPSMQHSLEREDNNGNYTPSNVVWATSDVQQLNKRSNRVVEYNGTKMTVTELAALTNVPRSRIFGRLRLGWTVERIISGRETS